MIREKLKIFKFGGASVRDARSVANLANILNSYRDEKIIVVISAIDKTTRELAKLTDLYFNKQDYSPQFKKIIFKHQSIINELFVDKQSVKADFEKLASNLKLKLSQQASSNYDFEYDQIVVYGELFSTKIISAYLQQKGFNCRWTDIRNLIKTDSNYRNARVDWQTSQRLLNNLQTYDAKLLITQGFIASNAQGLNTTLGIEGSDFTAAIIAYALNAEKVVVWKDVAGFYSSDPKMFDNVVKLDAVSFTKRLSWLITEQKLFTPKP